MSFDDVNRDLYCLLGLPFDAITMDETVKKVIDAVREKQKLFISTPNLNFLISAQKNDAFRNSVIHSDLSIADGMPIVFMCKMLGIPIKKRVAGSNMIEALIENEALKDKPIKVLFFGGDDGIAEKAHMRLNEMDGGLKSVGFLNPGFGSIEEMSAQEIIDEINEANPDFIIVSLGAAKGQAWIERNQDKLNASVISHLGAVINFIAGTIKRAPGWVQKIHMEWLWRIKEEPSLFSRYWNDGAGFIKLLFCNIMPLKRVINGQLTTSTPLINMNWEKCELSLKGSITHATSTEIKNIFKKIIEKKHDFTLDLNGVTFMDQAILGQLLILRENLARMDRSIKIMGLNHSVKRILKLNRLGYLLTEV